jgi:AraC-like DNA-binding protein
VVFSWLPASAAISIDFMHALPSPSPEGSTSRRGQIKGWLFEDIVFESHSGTPPDLPKHAHDAFQIGTTTRDPGDYLCNGERWYAPPGSMMVFNPGEVHSASPGVRLHTHSSRIMFVAPSRMENVARGVVDVAANLPRFAAPVITDRRVIGRFTRCYDLVNSQAPVLEKETALLETLGLLVRDFGRDRPTTGRLPRHRAKVEILREFIEVHFADNIGLADLARIVQISTYHVNRLFAQEIGMPPHAYQTQLRVERAKALLLGGMCLAEVALETGFFDQSHLARHFRRIVGVSPRSYASRRR